MKKVFVVISCVLLLCASVTSVAAENITQCFDLNASGDDKLVFTATNETTFWEKPTLASGQYSLITGSLIVRNSTSAEQKVGLRTVVLPYDNEDALRYLNHLYITVRDDSAVLYEGAYSRINDDRDFTMNTVLPGNSEVEFFIDLRCDYTYTGDGLSEDDMIKWEFYAVPDTNKKADNTSRFSDPALLEVLLACGIAAALLAGVFLYDRFRRNR